MSSNLPQIDNWRPFYGVVFGQVYNDPRFENGTWIQTSLIKSIDRKNNILKTKNSTYQLLTERHRGDV